MVGREPQITEGQGRFLFRFREQPEQNVFGAQIIVPETSSFLLRHDQDVAGSLCEAAERSVAFALVLAPATTPVEESRPGPVTLVGSLLGHPKALPDLRPRSACSSRLLDEQVDQLVPHPVQVRPDVHRQAQPLELRAPSGPAPDPPGHSFDIDGRIRHDVVNHTLTTPSSSRYG